MRIWQLEVCSGLRGGAGNVLRSGPFTKHARQPAAMLTISMRVILPFGSRPNRRLVTSPRGPNSRCKDQSRPAGPLWVGSGHFGAKIDQSALAGLQKSATIGTNYHARLRRPRSHPRRHRRPVEGGTRRQDTDTDQCTGRRRSLEVSPRRSPRTSRCQSFSQGGPPPILRSWIPNPCQSKILTPSDEHDRSACSLQTER
jgi:hypothetical protein